MSSVCKTPERQPIRVVEPGAPLRPITGSRLPAIQVPAFPELDGFNGSPIRVARTERLCPGAPEKKPLALKF